MVLWGPVCQGGLARLTRASPSSSRLPPGVRLVRDARKDHGWIMPAGSTDWATGCPINGHIALEMMADQLVDVRAGFGVPRGLKFQDDSLVRNT